MADGLIEAVILDWSGTAVDFGCFAPVIALRRALAESGVELSVEAIRGPMGVHKREHILTLLKLPEATEQWKNQHGRDWTDDDVDAIYERSLPLQIDEAVRRAPPIAGLLDCVAWLRQRGIPIGTTTGFPRAVGQPVAEAAAKHGYKPDVCVFADDVPSARPTAGMLNRALELLDVDSPERVIKAGDTLPDILEGRNAGAWSVGMVESGSDWGLSEEENSALSPDERAGRWSKAEERMRGVGAHELVASIADLPRAIDKIEKRIQAGERPK